MAKAAVVRGDYVFLTGSGDALLSHHLSECMDRTTAAVSQRIEEQRAAHMKCAQQLAAMQTPAATEEHHQQLLLDLKRLYQHGGGPEEAEAVGPSQLAAPISTQQLSMLALGLHTLVGEQRELREQYRVVAQLLSQSLAGSANSTQQLCHQSQAAAECVGFHLRRLEQSLQCSGQPLQRGGCSDGQLQLEMPKRQSGGEDKPDPNAPRKKRMQLLAEASLQLPPEGASGAQCPTVWSEGPWDENMEAEAEASMVQLEAVAEAAPGAQASSTTITMNDIKRSGELVPVACTLPFSAAQLDSWTIPNRIVPFGLASQPQWATWQGSPEWKGLTIWDLLRIWDEGLPCHRSAVGNAMEPFCIAPLRVLQYPTIRKRCAGWLQEVSCNASVE